MQLHELKTTQKFKSKKRVGRGGKRGTYSGKGQKGQKSRAGHKIRPAERDLILRLPKLRGFKFRTQKAKPVIINIGDLAAKVKGDIINKDVLLRAGLIKKSDKRVKILGKGDIKTPLTIEGLEVSKSVRNKVESSGGSIK